MVRAALSHRVRGLSPVARLAAAIVLVASVAVALIIALGSLLSSSSGNGVASVPGASDHRAGVPVGYAHTRAGAAAAAVNYSAVFLSAGPDVKRAEPVIQTLATPSAAPSLLDRVRGDARTFARRLPGRRISITVKPVARRTPAYDSSSAVVEVALTGTITITPGGAPEQQCFLYHFDMAWSWSDWKATGIYRLDAPKGDCTPPEYTRVHAG